MESYKTRVTVHWENGVCDGYSSIPMCCNGQADASQQAVDHMRELLGVRYPELGNLTRIEVDHAASE